MQSSAQRPRLGSTSLEVPGNGLRSPPVTATASPIHAINSQHQSLASPINALPPSLAVRQMSGMDPRQQYGLPGPPPGGPLMQMGGGIPLPPPPPRQIQGPQQVSGHWGMMPPPPPGPPPMQSLPTTPYGFRSGTNPLPPPPPPQNHSYTPAIHTAYNQSSNQNLHNRYQNQQSRQTSNHFAAEMPNNEENKPLVSATYTPGGDSWGLGVGVPSMSLERYAQEEPRVATTRQLLEDAAVGSSGSGVNRRDPFSAMGISSPPLSSEPLPPYLEEDRMRHRSDSGPRDEKTRYRQQDYSNSALHSSGGNGTPNSADRARDSSKTRGDDPESKWSLDRVLSWLAQNSFSKDWQKAFDELHISGSNFLEIGVGSGGRGNLYIIHNIVLPAIQRFNATEGKAFDQPREREESQRLRRLIRQAAEGVNYSTHGDDARWKGHDRQASDRLDPAGDSEYSPELQTPDTVDRGEQSPRFGSTFFKPPSSPMSNRSLSSFRQIPYGTKRNGTTAVNEPNASETTGRADITRDILSRANGQTLRHSPNPSVESNQTPDGRSSSRFANDDGSVSSSPARSHFLQNGPGYADHHRQDSSQSINSVRDTRRRGTLDETRPPPVETGRHVSDGPVSGQKDHRKFLDFFKPKRSRHSDDNPDSPTSPVTFQNRGAYIKANSSETSVDRPTSTQSISDADKTVGRGRAAKRDKRYIFATYDGVNYRLIEVSNEDSAEGLRQLILTSLFPDRSADNNAVIYLTNPGDTPEDLEPQSPLSPNSLLQCKRGHADAHGSLKVFVLPGRPLPRNVLATKTSSLSLGVNQSSPVSNTFEKILGEDRSAPNPPRTRAPSNQPSPSFATFDPQVVEDFRAEAQEEPSIPQAEREAALQLRIKEYREEIERKKQQYLSARGPRQGSTSAEHLAATRTTSRPVSIQGKNLIDFDAGRESPYEKTEMKPDNIAPKRAPPTAPAAGSETLRKVNSKYRKSEDPVDDSGRRLSGEDGSLSPPTRRGAVTNSSSTSLNAALARAGSVSKSEGSPRLDMEIPHGTLSPPGLTDEEERTKRLPGAAATSGQSTPTSALKSPEKSKERGLGAIARIAAGTNSNQDDKEKTPTSEGPRRTMSVASVRSFGPSFEVKDEVQFAKSPALQQQSDSDDDSDDGLFARPIKATEAPPTPVKPRSSIRPKPALGIVTDRNRQSVHFQDPTSDDQGKSSAPESAKTIPSSPDTKLNRRKSLIQRSNVWANRPPVEAILQDLDAHFPDVNLDEAIVETNDASPPTTPTNAVPPVPPTPADYATKGHSETTTMMSHQARPLSIATDAIKEEDENDTLGEEATIKGSDSVAKRNIRKSGLSRKKTIREVARQSMLVKRQSTLHSRSNGNRDSYASGKPMSDLHRRKSTKMFGHNIVQMVPGRGSRDSLVLHQSEMSSKLNKRATTFRILRGELIGKGTYGRVYLGINANTGDVLAIKNVTVNKAAAGKDKAKMKELVAALDREIDTMQHLEHPNIVQYLGSEKGDFAISIFLEYIEGGSIGSCLRRHGKFEERIVADLTRQALDGLAYLHGQGILHRDLKADNILLDTDGTCKISDFGISKRSDNIYGNDATNNMQGSVFWMAPEVVRSQGQGYSAKVDIWSLGCVVLEMFAGKRPWGRDEAMSAIYKLTNNQTPPIPSEVEKGITPTAIGFMYDCFTIDPGQRPTAETLKQDSQFCRFDEYYNFMDTELYKKLKGIKEFNI